MKLSCTLGGHGSLTEQIERLKRCGFDACAFPMEPVFGKNGALGDIEHVSDEMIYDFFMPLRALGDRLGISFVQTHSVGDGELADENLDDMLRREIAVIKATKILGAKYVVMRPIIERGRIYEKRAESNFERAARFLEALTPTLAEQGVCGCVQNVFTRDPAFQFTAPTICSTPDELVRMCDRLGEHYGICLDVGNAVLGREHPSRIARAGGERIRLVNVHDNDGFDNLHAFPFSRHRPHTGNPPRVDWPKMMRALSDIEYDGIFNLDVTVPGPRALCDAGYEYLAELGQYLLSLRQNSSL